jgi:hypothetical protein
MASTFDSNIAIEKQGEAIYAINSDEKLSLNSCYFYNAIPQNFLYLQDIANFEFIESRVEANSKFKNTNRSELTLNSALIIQNVKNMSISGSVFKHLVSNQGSNGAGAIYVSESPSNKDLMNSL